MAGNIKGITIEIDGDTRKLNSALKGVNQNIRDTQYQLRDVDKALKLKPGNTELLQQKFKLLGQSVQDAKDKLNLLEQAQESAAKQLASGEIGQADYDALTSKIAAARAEVEKLQKAYDDFGSVSAQKIAAAGEKVEEFGGKVATVGDALTTGVTAPLVAVGGAGVAAWKELDGAMDSVATRTGATGDELAKLQDQTKNIAETIPTDFQTAADAVGEVNTRFGVTGDELEDLSTQFIKFADINNTEVSASIDSVQSVMAAWGVKTEDAGLLLDTLTKAGQETGVSVEKLSGDLAANKTYLDEMGFSLSDSTMFLANLDKNGVDATAAMTGMKKALANATKEGKTSSEAMKDLQDSIANSTDKTEAYQKATELFGAKAGPALADAIMEGRISFEELGTTMSDFSGTTEKTFNETLDPVDQLTTAMNTAKDIGAELGGTILEVLNPAMKKLSDGIKKAKKRWDELSPKTKDMIVKIGLVAAAIGPVLSVGGRLISGAGKIMKLAPKLVGAVQLLAGPFGLVAVAIAAAIAIGIVVIKNWDQIKAKAQELGQKIQQTWNNIKNWTVTTWNNIKQAISDAWNTIKTTVSTAIDNVKTKLETTWNNIKTTVTNTWNNIKTTITSVFNGIKTFISTTIDAIKTKLSTTWDAIRTAISTKIDAIKTAISTKWDAIKTTISTKIDGIKNDISSKWDAIKTNITQKVDGIKSSLSQKWDAIKNDVGSKLSGIKEKITKPFTDAKALVTEAINKIKQLFPIKLGNIFSGVKLPHFKISGGRLPWGIGGKGVAPSVRVEWYRKAYDNAVMFTDPTVLSTPSGYKGFGDGSGGEIVMGKDYMLGMIQEAVSGSSLSRNMAAVGQMLENMLPIIANKQFILSGSDFIYANRQNMNAALGNEAILTERGVR